MGGEAADRAAKSPVILGVTHSIDGRRWVHRGGDDRMALAIAQRRNLPDVMGRIIAARVSDPDMVERYLNPTLRDDLPDPSRLADMDRAADRLARAVIARESIAIFGDYDVDGATSSALFDRYFRALGIIVRLYIPDRLTEGYGPNGPALRHLREEGVSLVVTVDCGTTAHGALTQAAEVGLDVVVVDHHAAEASLPPHAGLVNPNRLDDESGQGVLAAVGVSFLVAVATNRALRAAGFFADRPEPDLKSLLDLVALGTVCDVVPLVGVNRALVTQGLKIMAQRRNAGLVALADKAGVSERIDAYHLGYVLGPRVNAGGRVGKSDLGCRLLACDDPVVAAELAQTLDLLNGERRAIEAAVLEQAIEQVDRVQDHGPILIAEGEGWHPGVIGIVAGRLKERYNRPACVIAWENGIGKASGRSVPGVDLGAAIIAARQAGYLVAGGGHAMAAGFTVMADQAAGLTQFLRHRLTHLTADLDLTPELGIDGVMQVAAATPDLVALIAKLGPFGAGNSEPRFVLPHLRVVKADVVGANHVRVLFAPAAGTEKLKAMAFRAMEGALGPALLQSGGAALHVAGHIRADTWQGRNGVQLFIDDIAFAYQS